MRPLQQSLIMITYHYHDHMVLITYHDDNGDYDDDDDDLSIIDPNLGVAKPIGVNVAQIANMAHLYYQ